MLFPTVTFAVFLVTVYAAHVALESRDRAWKVAMLVASYVFYGWWDWRFCGLLAASTLVNWGVARLLGLAAAGGRAARILLGLAVAANLGLLSLFKYYGFFVETVGEVLGSSSALPVLEVALPVGISFFTFQALSYVIDTYRGQVDSRSLLDFGVYLSFFPHLVAGPIVRASEFLPQLVTRTAPGQADLVNAAWFIGRGLFKKLVVATYLAETVVDPVFAAPSAATKTELALAMYGYAIQIYADFSGYTDMAIGLAALFGIRFPLNFDRPYAATSIQDFWRRWHMTLSRWLRDYLYVALGGSRGRRWATYRNLMITMVLGGLWHGAAWTFVIWGAVHGAALGLERVVTTRAGSTSDDAAVPVPAGLRARHRWWLLPPTGRLGTAVRWLVTFHVVCVAWILFRAQDLDLAGDFLRGLVTAPTGGAVNPVAAAVILVALTAQLAPIPTLRLATGRLSRLNPVFQSALAGAFLSLAIALGPDGVAPFIYFQF